MSSSENIQKLQKLQNEYDDLTGILTDLASKLCTLKFQNKELDELKQKMLETVKNEETNLFNSSRTYLNSIVWDRLVIAFFGETNAGKSTIIESLRILLNEESREKSRNKFTLFERFIRLFGKKNPKPTDGLIVGDGRQDFTKEYHEYNMEVNGKPFTLIDVPGIEGNESAYTDGIKNALEKAHYVFYVVGKNKNTDEGTAKKIKYYLKEWVKVLTIYNVRDNAEAYEFAEDRKTLKTANVRKVSSLLENSFRLYLGNHFDGVISLQGFLAMSAYAEFSPKRQDLIKRQQELKIYFGEDASDNVSIEEQIKRFSRVDEIIHLIENKSHNFISEIEEANNLKLMTYGKHIYDSVQNVINNSKYKFSNYSTVISKFKSETESILKKESETLKNSIKTNVSHLLNELQKSGYECIDIDDISGINKLFDDYKKNLKTTVKRTFRKSLISMNESIKSASYRLSEIPGISSLKIDDVLLGNIQTRAIDIDAIYDADGVSFGDICNLTAKTAGLATGGLIFGPIGGIVGGLIGFLSGIFSCSNDQYERAKEKFHEEIEKQRLSTDKWLEDLNKEFDTILNARVKKIHNKLDPINNDINRYLNSVNEASNKIYYFINYHKNYNHDKSIK